MYGGGKSSFLDIAQNLQRNIPSSGGHDGLISTVRWRYILISVNSLSIVMKESKSENKLQIKCRIAIK